MDAQLVINSTHVKLGVSNAYLRIIGAYDYFVFKIILRTAFTSIIAIFGIISNPINLLVYYRQGILSDSCTVSLAGLAVSDFLSCLFVFWGGLCYGIGKAASFPNMNFDLMCILSVDGPAQACTQITCWITAYIAFERFISVVFPFKVKLIFTPQRSCVFLTIAFLLNFLLFIPNFAHSKMEWVKKTPNSSYYLDRVQNEGFTDVRPLFEYINGIGFRFACVIIVILCNIGILIKVNISKKFRSSMSLKTKSANNEKPGTSDGNKTKSDGDERREMRLLKMIIIICALFVVCYATDIAIIILLGDDVGLNFHFLSRGFMFNIITVLTTFNSSINIVIYYSLSTRFKEEFRRLFNMKEAK